MRAAGIRASTALCAGLLAGCGGVQSALAPAGVEATEVATLFRVMVAGGAAIWLAVVGLMLHALRRRRRVHRAGTAGALILWGGAVFPSLTLAALLGYALWLMPAIRPWAEAGEAGRLRVEVTGHQYWWRVAYHPADGGPPVLSANEIRLPVGERVDFVLTSADVIHSFWIPPLGGKMDMIPGRTNRLSLQATEAGTFRGPCTEFCGTSHALMAFPAIAMPPDQFAEWLAQRAAPSPNAGGAGAELFLRHGCGACHRIDGTEAQGGIGPDLSHVGSRAAIGAGILPNSEEAIARFIADPDAIKPGVLMPAFDMLPPEQIAAIAAYLRALR